MDLIDREQAIEHLKNRLLETAINNVGIKVSCDSIFADIAYNRIEPWINEVPRIEATGKWLYYLDNGRMRCKCSNCLTSYGCLDTPYCPNCGFKMEDKNMNDKENYCKDCDRSIYAENPSCDVNIENNGKYVGADEKCYCKIVNGKMAEKYPWED